MKLLPSADYFRDNVAFRNDTLLGACEAVGTDLGFHPNWLRIPLSAGIIVAPLLMVGLYLGLCVIAFTSRTFFPDRVNRVAPQQAASVEAAQNDQAEIPQAA